VGVAIDVLASDLLDETRALDDVLSRITDADWELATPSPGWAVRDQVSHLAYFDDATTIAVADPEAFARERVVAVRDIDAFTARVAADHRDRSQAELLAWWRAARPRMVATLRTVGRGQRVPWYGPDMSVPTALTARIMETWAHGQDVVDATGVERESTAALRHVAHLGVRTLANSFTTRGRPAPEDPVLVELTAGDEVWTWGDSRAANVVRGPARDFCLVVTQRRHLDDTALDPVGPVEVQWMAIAQAFAGPPGAGRTSGQFGGPGAP
jgi:uncharacterized protein (TIGR03084 family)